MMLRNMVVYLFILGVLTIPYESKAACKRLSIGNVKCKAAEDRLIIDKRSVNTRIFLHGNRKKKTPIQVYCPHGKRQNVFFQLAVSQYGYERSNGKRSVLLGLISSNCRIVKIRGQVNINTRSEITIVKY